MDAGICGPNLEEGDRLGRCGTVPGSGARFLLQRERRHLDDTLPGNSQRLTAGGQQANSGSFFQDDVRKHGNRVEEMLTVIEDEQRFA